MRRAYRNGKSIKGHTMKTTWIALLLLVACSSCTVSERKSGMLGYTWTFENSTLSEAIDDIRRHEKWGTTYSFRVRNDREFERLVFKDVTKPIDLLREIKSAIDCEILEAGRSAIIMLPKLE